MDPNDFCRSTPVATDLASAPTPAREEKPAPPIALHGSKSPLDVLNSESGNMAAAGRVEVSALGTGGPFVDWDAGGPLALDCGPSVLSALDCGPFGGQLVPIDRGADAAATGVPSLGAGGGAFPAPNRPVPDLDLLFGDSVSFLGAAAAVAVFPFAPPSPLPKESPLDDLCKSPSELFAALSGFDANNLASGGSSSTSFPSFASAHPPPSSSLAPSSRLPMLPCRALNPPPSLPPPVPKERDPALPLEVRSPPLLRVGNDDSASAAPDDPNPRGAGG
mmetsp:Transcript_625/g.2295  ORF Transcript_625/g.2295 Transcript_625/m.2295 type:complete len:277 (-) Transcript_625:1265-2095(-)